MPKWRYKVLKNQEAENLILNYKEGLRVEKYNGAPHLQLKQPNGEYKTVGRIRKDLFKRLPFELAEEQSKFINISYWIIKT